MKKAALLIGLLWLTVTAVPAQERTGTYSFDRTSHDFGTVRRGEKSETVFVMTNTGTTPLVVLDVKISCNCIKTEWPRNPIPPGESAKMTVTYKDRNTGAFYKQMEIVTTGTPQTAKITLKGSVE